MVNVLERTPPDKDSGLVNLTYGIMRTVEAAVMRVGNLQMEELLKLVVVGVVVARKRLQRAAEVHMDGGIDNVKETGDEEEELRSSNVVRQGFRASCLVVDNQVGKVWG